MIIYEGLRLETRSLPHTVRSVRHDVTAWRLRSWIDKYLGRRLAVMSQQLAATGTLPRSASGCAGRQRHVVLRDGKGYGGHCRRAEEVVMSSRPLPWPPGMLLNVCPI
jgi:hypothetical protein